MTPQRPGHGSWHFLLIQALLEGQSEFTTHSGRQFGGDPIISGKQEHWHCPPMSLGGFELGPHGLGSQGSRMTGGLMVCGIREHAEKGSPRYPGLQVHTGLWLTTLHFALTPQTPGQGSTQCKLTQALLEGQSALMVHSGRHATYGSPKYSGIHWHAPALALAVHLALLPHGEGLQGSMTSVGAMGVVIRTQAVKASPVYPGSHLHWGTWLVTEQVA